MAGSLLRVGRALLPLVLFLVCVFVQPGCTCAPDTPPAPFPGLIACRPQHPTRPTVARGAPGVETVAAGTLPETFSITSTGGASLAIPLVAVPGRAGVEPRLSLTHDSSGDGVVGAGFSIAGLSAITRCPKNLAQDGEIRDVRYNETDALCLDNKRLVVVGEEPGLIEYRTFPDTSVKVMGHFPEGEAPGSALHFEVFTPSGLVIEYGTGDGGKPLARGGVPHAWLATRAHDGRGNAMTYGYCFAEADGYTAEYAVDEIRYTHFDGSPSVEASRAVKLVYGTKDPVDIRTVYSGGMALQSSLRLDEI